LNQVETSKQQSSLREGSTVKTPLVDALRFFFEKELKAA
jgi:hypothetical protein